QVYFTESNGLATNECRTILLHYTTTCNPDYNGATACITAHAFSDSVANASPLWDKSNVVIEVNHGAAQDSVEFFIQNNGTGNMSSPLPLIVIEDNIIMMNQQLQLNAGEIIRQK